MLDHHIQKQIVYALAFADALRFSELKPDDLENKAFDYHLKKVIAAGYVTKTDDGLYTLTSEGKRVGKGALKQQKRLIDRAYSILLLAARRPEDDAWLLVRRKSQPLIDLKGLPGFQPTVDLPILQTVERAMADIGLAGTYNVHGHGYFRISRRGELESFTHFTLLTSNDIQGALRQNSSLVEYYWDTDPDFAAPDMLPNMQTLRKMLAAPAGCFAEQTFDIE